MTSLKQPSSSNGVINPARRIASVINVNGNSLASTPFIWESGLSLFNALPCFAVVKHRSGTYTLGVIKIDVSTVVLSALVPLNGLANGSPCIFNILTTGVVISSGGTLQATIATINGSAATFDVFLYGFSY